MRDTLTTFLKNYERAKPRATQKQIGPSEAGHPCPRRIAYKILDTPQVNTDSDPWASIIGTAVHAYLDDVYKTDDRFLTDVRVTIPEYMSGTLDLYDRETKTVIDHKVVGKSTLDKYKKNGVTDQYKTQVNLYALGLILAGHEVDNVAVMYWSRTGGLKDALYWEAPYDEQLVEDTLRRLDAINTVVKSNGTHALSMLPAVDSHCIFCPYYLPGATDLTECCPGAPQPNPTQQRKNA